MALGCPVWTEDADFFGTGVATWTSDRVALYLAGCCGALLANPAVRQAYDAQAPEFELARELIAALMRAGLTQGDVAARMGTTHSDRSNLDNCP